MLTTTNGDLYQALHWRADVQTYVLTCIQNAKTERYRKKRAYGDQLTRSKKKQVKNSREKNFQTKIVNFEGKRQGKKVKLRLIQVSIVW